MKWLLRHPVLWQIYIHHTCIYIHHICIYYVKNIFIYHIYIYILCKECLHCRTKIVWSIFAFTRRSEAKYTYIIYVYKHHISYMYIHISYIYIHISYMYIHISYVIYICIYYVKNVFIDEQRKFTQFAQFCPRCSKSQEKF